MTNRRLQIPEGMQDTLPAECHVKRELESNLRGLFHAYGYQEIETPLLEYYDTLSDETWGYAPEKLWKTFDSEGRVLAVRPDTTVPAARLAAGRLRESQLPLRLSYIQNACKYEKDTLSMLSEQPQAGVELMGTESPEADAEVIAIAIESLKRAGIRDFQIELGQAAFLDGLIAQAGLESGDIAYVRKLMEEKNTLGIQLYLHKRGVSEEITRLLARLPLLYGPLDKLEKAEKMTNHPQCLAALDNLRRIIAILHQYGYEELTLDLGMTQEAGYYSGVIFRANTAHVGQSILSGGRYDGLNRRYGHTLPAVGFAMNLKLAMIALERQGLSLHNPLLDWEIGYEDGCFQDALALAAKLRGEGKNVAMAYGTGRKELEARRGVYAREVTYLTKEGAEHV